MREESTHNIPQENVHELVHVYIASELEKARIEIRQINIDGTLTTDKTVPEETMSSIREYAASKGITIKFLTSA